MIKNARAKLKGNTKTLPKKVVKSKSLRRPVVRKQHVWFIVGLVVIIAAVYGVVGHNKIDLKYHKVRYGMDVRHAFNDEYVALNEPLAAFGITKSPKSTCLVELDADYAAPQLQCNAQEQPYTVIGKSSVSKAHYVAEAALLDQQLSENGWTENHNAAPSYKDWMQAITSGKDWYPDEGAYKNFGNDHCWMDAFLAYANPAPPAFSMHVGCDAPALKQFLTLPF